MCALCLNFSQVTEEPLDEVEEDSNLWNTFDEEEEEEGMVFFVLEESTGYMAPALRALAVIHTIISFVCVIGYYCLKASSESYYYPVFVKGHCPKVVFGAEIKIHISIQLFTNSHSFICRCFPHILGLAGKDRVNVFHSSACVWI